MTVQTSILPHHFIIYIINNDKMNAIAATVKDTGHTLSTSSNLATLAV